MNYKLIIIPVVMVLLVLNTNAFAQNCSGSGCIDAGIQNEMNVSHQQFLYYNNKSASWAMPHSPHSVQLPSYFVDAPRGMKFQPILNVVQFHMVFTKDQLKNMLKAGNWFFNADIEIDATPLVRKIDEEYYSPTVTVLFYVKGLRLPAGSLTAQLSGRADDADDATSAQVFAALCLEAMKYGSNAVYVSGEGAERVLTAFGWGVGASHTQASISDSGQNAGTTSGGIGFSGGSTKYLDQPWIQVDGLTVSQDYMAKRIEKIKDLWNQNTEAEEIVTQLEIEKRKADLEMLNQRADVNARRTSVLNGKK